MLEMIQFKFLCLFALFSLANCEWLDLSYPYNNKTLYWGTSTRFQHKLVYAGPIKEKNITLALYYSSYDLTTAEHGGTHIDAPIHFAQGAWAIDDIPAENLVGKAVVVNISAKAAKDRNAQLTTSDLHDWETEHGTIPDASILFVFTGWGQYWPDYEKYFGTSTTNSTLYRFPGITANVTLCSTFAKYRSLMQSSLSARIGNCSKMRPLAKFETYILE